MSETRIPLLIISDDPALPTGLARIARDLAALIVERFSDTVELAVLGCGAYEDRRTGAYPVYRMTHLESACGRLDMDRLEHVFFKGRRPILWPVWDATRSLWLRPKQEPTQWGLVDGLNAPEAAQCTAWGYFPFDSFGLDGLQPKCVLDVLRRFDYLAVPSQFAARTLGDIPCDVIPHGFDPAVFYPRERVEGLMMLNLPPDTKHLVGIVATNQARKDWGLMADTCRLLARADDSIRFWWHVDSLDRNWNLPLLVQEFELEGKVLITKQASEDALAKAYSACDVTLAPGLGEGFGYPILESIACGTPVVHGEYGAGQEIINSSNGGCAIKPREHRWETSSFPILRPVYRADRWSEATLTLMDLKRTRWLKYDVAHYAWANLAPTWEAWIRAGIAKHLGASAAPVSIETAR